MKTISRRCSLFGVRDDFFSWIYLRSSSWGISLPGSFVCLYCFQKTELKVGYYQRQFRLSFFGSLTSEYNVLFSGEGNKFAAAINKCSEFCRSDIRCIGMELCKVRNDLYRCRACCETMKLEEKTRVYNDRDTCRYLEMDKDMKDNIALNKPTSISSMFKPEQQASNAVDSVTVCPTGLVTAHTKPEFRPWIKIDLQSVYDVNRVIIYNRQDQSGNRLHDLQLDVGINGTDTRCGFYKGPGETGDRIVVLCKAGSQGDYVLLTIMSQPGQNDILNVCEVQVFANN